MQTLFAFITPAHAGLGVVALLFGTVALAARKGHATHIRAGRLFLVFMALVSVLGAGLGLLNAQTQYITFHAGLLALTLIASGWLAARGHEDRAGAAVWMVGLVNLANAVALVALGMQAQTTEGGMLLGFPAEDYFFLAGMAGVAAAGDASLAFRKEISERHRIARHLWRMCVGFFIAAGSAFTGPGAGAFPEELRDAGVLVLPELIILALMLFWLARTLRGRESETRRSAA